MSLQRGFTLDVWRVYPLEGVISGPAGERRIQPKSMDVLLQLAAAPDEVLERETILRAVWGERAQTDEPLTRCIGELRRAFADTGEGHDCIQTIPKRGYKLLLQVEMVADPVEPGNGEEPGSPRANAMAGTAATRSVPFPAWKRHGLVFSFMAMLLLAAIFYLADSFTPQQGGRESRDEGQADNAGAEGVAEKSLVVLPFRVMSDGPDDAYFADGLTEEIINSLAQLPELQVTARTSAFFFKDRDLRIPEIASSLGVAHALEGSVRREGQRLRITAQLIRADRDFHLWSATYDRVLEDTFAVQLDIAENVAAALDVIMDDERRARMRAAGVGDPQAFVAYQKGLELYLRAHPNEDQLALLAQANAHFEEAIGRVPGFADAYHRHADYYTHVVLDFAAGREFGDDSAEDIGTASMVLRYDLDAAVNYARDEGRRLNNAFDRALLTGDWLGLSASIDRLLERSTCTGSLWLQTVALPYDKTKEVRQFFRNQIDCDPLQSLGWVWDANALIWLGEFEQAAETARAGMAIVPQERLRSTMVRALIAAGGYEEAESVIERDLVTMVSRSSNRIMLAAARGDQQQARSLVDAFRAEFLSGSENALHFYAWLGDRASANRTAAEVDARPFGHMILVIAINNCYCGAPFDLEVTPVFAGLLQDAALPWPPSSPIEWPLKKW